jgi:hypothetical protein
MNKCKNKRHLFILFFVFALVLTMSVAYAASTGQLAFTGTAHLGDSGLELTMEADDFVNNLDPRIVSVIVSADGQTATISVDLEDPGDDVTVSFDIENTGLANAAITGFTLGTIGAPLQVSGEILGFASYPVLVNVGAMVCFELNIEWDDGHPTADGSHSFTVSLDYAIAP